jgi:hypothetical protein
MRLANSAIFSRIGMADEFARENWQRQFCVHRPAMPFFSQRLLTSSPTFH